MIKGMSYEITDLPSVLTPALVIYPELVRHNIRETLRLMNGNPQRWRPHVKTAKLQCVMRMMVEAGVEQFKCATTLELLTACGAGAKDVLVAYPHNGANAARVAQIAKEHPEVLVSVLIDAAEQIDIWRGAPVSVFIDINPGMNRTGIEEEGVKNLLAAVRTSGLEFRGLHYYDGHIHDENLERRKIAAHRGYERLCAVVSLVGADEVITAGTPAFPYSLDYPGFVDAGFIHRVSPGTVIYNDMSSIKQLPQCDYKPAALVVSRVVSHPKPGIVTCDAGHKSLSVDAGVPNGSAVGHEQLNLLKPSEEHLPIEVPAGIAAPALGSFLYFVPRHVCPTVNNFDFAVMVEDRAIVGVEPVTARGREFPLLDGVEFALGPTSALM